MYSNDKSGRNFAWQDISTDATSSLRQQMRTLNVSGEAKEHTAEKDGNNIGSQSEEVSSSSSLKIKVHGIEVLLLTMAVEMEKGMEARRVQKYEQLQLHLNQNEKAPAENGRAKLPAKPASLRSIRNETLRANERRMIHQIETEKLRSRKRKKMIAQLLKRLGDTPATWKPSVSSELDRKVEGLICEARMHDLTDTAEEMAKLLHQKKQLRDQYFTAKRNEREAKQNVLKEARNERKELLLLARLHRRGAKNKIKSAKKASEERVRRLLSRGLVNRQWQEIQHTAYNTNFTRPCTFSYFQPKKKARRVATA